VLGATNADNKIVLDAGVAAPALAATLDRTVIGSYTGPDHVTIYDNSDNDGVMMLGTANANHFTATSATGLLLAPNLSPATITVSGASIDNDGVQGLERDLLTGDAAGSLQAGGDDEILIGDQTTYGLNIKSLLTIVREWTRTDADYATRIAHLRNGGGRNGSTLLNLRKITDQSSDARNLLGTGPSDGVHWRMS
jgi:hypothetical protein